MLAAIVYVTALVASALASDCRAKEEEPWSYEGANGPDHWGENYADCNGSKQSPITIDPRNTVSDSSAQNRLELFGYDTPLTGELENNGHAVYVRPKDGISRGIRVNSEVYNFVQSHFHFGKRAGEGSEHIVSGEQYSMELHLVHQNSRNELAVVGIFFEEDDLHMEHNHTQHVHVHDEDNKFLSPITKNLRSIEYEGEKVGISGVVFEGLLPECESPVFYSYDGSLTTPPCSEGVKWFVMNGGTHVSHQQMWKFRHLKATRRGAKKCYLAGNFRPPQSLNGRTVTAFNGDCINRN